MADARWQLRSDVPDWRDAAACRGMEPRLFYPGREAKADDTRQARETCASCPVRAQCYLHALHHEWFGIWGGASERERRQARRRLGIRVSVPEGAAMHELVRSDGESAERQRRRRQRATQSAKTCAWCRAEFMPYQSNEATCSPACSEAERARRNRLWRRRTAS